MSRTGSLAATGLGPGRQSESRLPAPPRGAGEIPMRRLVNRTLRSCPFRVVVGELPRRSARTS
jgi:Flp pilus assembly CpaF family ATPase